jgi:hypothetical protein
LSHNFCPFCAGYVGDGVSLFFQAGLEPQSSQSDSQAARITGVSHQCPATIIIIIIYWFAGVKIHQQLSPLSYIF